MNMQKIEVGKVYDLGSRPRTETVRCALNSSFFDVVYYVDSKNIFQLKEIWNKSEFKYGYFVHNAAVFCVIDFIGKNWFFDFSINILKIRNYSDVMNWLRNSANVVKLIMVDLKTNKVIAIRVVSLDKDFVKGVKLHLMNQLTLNVDEIEKQISHAESLFSTDQMILLANMYKF